MDSYSTLSAGSFVLILIFILIVVNVLKWAFLRFGSWLSLTLVDNRNWSCGQEGSSGYRL